jgi:hypothetical protein
MTNSNKPREYHATQILGAEDGKYIMSDDIDFIEKMSMVEVSFKVIEAEPTLALIAKLEAALEQYSNPEWPETAAFKALEELAKWRGEKCSTK